MKKALFLIIILVPGARLFSQPPPAQPTSPGGNSLYKKSCERAGVNFNVCIYCEDDRLTQNCKKYWCQDNGTCVEAPIQNNRSIHVNTNINISEKIIQNKRVNGTSILHTEAERFRLYAFYRQNQLEELYAIDNNGRKIFPKYFEAENKTTTGSTHGTCYACVSTSGKIVCYIVSRADVLKGKP